LIKTQANGPFISVDELVDDTEGAALTLEHQAFGRSRMEGRKSFPDFGARAGISVSKHISNTYALHRVSASQSGYGVSPSLGIRGSHLGSDSPMKP
jgi:hypothetical protein